METPSFDFESVESEPAAPEWQEVPQALFLSWSKAMQLAYCARRDEDAAIGGETPTMFYVERAEMYREMLRGIHKPK